MDCEISFSSIGSAPILMNSARSWASCVLPTPSIWAPVSPGIPSGLSTKLMIARETTSSSSTIEKLSEYCAAACELPDTPGGALCSPRSAIVLVTSWKLSFPSPVKLKVTIGDCVVGSWFASGSVISSPERAGRSRSTNHWALLGSSSGCSPSSGGALTTRIPCGTTMISDPGGCTSPGWSTKRSSLAVAGPER